MTEDTVVDSKTAAPSVVLARQIWIEEFRTANPNASTDEAKAAWVAVAPAYRKTVRTALRKLEKKGITLQQG
jgi:hypothetical protein